MKKYYKKLSDNYLYKIVLLWLFICYSTSYQNAFPQKLYNNPVKKQNFVINKISEFNWDTYNGLPYQKDYGANYGVTSFNVLDKNNIAFLSKVKRKIKIFDIQTNQLVKEFDLGFFPVDFTYYNENFYVLTNYKIVVFNKKGQLIHIFKYDKKIKSVENIRVINNKLFIISSEKKTYLIAKNNKSAGKTYNGCILDDNMFAKTIKLNNHQYLLEISDSQTILNKQIFNTEKKLSCARIINKDKNYIYLDLEYIINDIPLKVCRNIVVIAYKNNIIKGIVNTIKVPNIYYIYMKHDIQVTSDCIYYIVTTPDNAQLFSLSYKNINNKDIEKVNKFPNELFDYEYHYNEHTLEIDELDNNNIYKSTKDLFPIYRSQIINNAEPYESHVWYCNTENIKDYDCGGVHVTTPSWVSVGTNVSVPYMWGGFSSLSQFNQGLLDEVSAGDCNTTGSGSGSNCAVGVDCSGFVSKAWDLPVKYSTSGLPNISTEYASYDELLPGDIVNYAGHHVRLIDTLNIDGSFLIIEASASATNWSVGYTVYTVSDLQANYVPRYYDNVINGVMDTILPVTSVYAGNWQTENFMATFNDTDNNAVDKKFYQPLEWTGTEWRANKNNGFFNDNFESYINPDWTIPSDAGIWLINNGHLRQLDQSVGNSNIYTQLEQNDSNEYLYHWSALIDGLGTNRRCGLHIFVSDSILPNRGNSYLIWFLADQQKVKIYKTLNDTLYLKAENPININTGVWYDFKTIYNPVTGNIQAFINNNSVVSWTDSLPITTGKYLSLRNGDSDVQYDDIKVYKSRQDTVFITVGTNINDNVGFQNPNPLTPACRIKSIVTDSAGNFSVPAGLDVNIDWTLPDTGNYVYDGINTDIDTTNFQNQLSANWAAFLDTNSEIKRYFYSIGISQQDTSIVGWTDNGLDTNITKSGLTLINGQTYYFNVKAENNAELFSDVISSDGQTYIDTSDNINEFSNDFDLTVYPNPFNDNVIINYTLKNQEQVKISLTDILGKEIIIADYDNQKKGKYNLNINTKELGIHKGIYLLRFSTKTKNINIYLVKY